MLNENELRKTVIRMRKRMIHFEHEGDYWSEDEKEQLVLMFESGCGITDMAIALQRTEPTICQQIEKMDLYRRKENVQRRKNAERKNGCLCSRCTADRSLCPRCINFEHFTEGE